MKRNYFHWSLLTVMMAAMLSVSFVACGEDDKSPVLNVDVAELLFEAEGGSQSFRVTSNTEWTIIDDPAWLTVTPNSSSNDKTVYVKVAENTTNNERTCTLRITAEDGISAFVKITQSKANGSLTLGTNNLNFASGNEKNFTGDTKTLQIRCNTSWNISGQPEWLDLSSTSGNGEQTITLTTKSFNNSSSPRTATLTVATIDGTSTETVEVSQNAGLAANCNLSITNVVTLYNGIAFEFEFGREVARFYLCSLKKSDVGTVSEAEIIEEMESNDRRLVPSEYMVYDFDELDENTDYVIYALGYNSNGVRGELVKKEASTKKLLDNWTLNEPMAWISDITQDDTYWYWQITKGTRCRTYFELDTQDEDFAFSSDVFQAWLIDYYQRTGQIYEYENAEPLMWEKRGSLCAVITWGRDSNGQFANCINWNCSYNSNASRTAPSKKKNSQPTASCHKLPKKDAVRVRMMSR